MNDLLLTVWIALWVFIPLNIALARGEPWFVILGVAVLGGIIAVISGLFVAILYDNRRRY